MTYTRTLPWAAPSFVIPADVAENAAFLAHKVQEVGLCFFEARSCLMYTEKELPQSLRALPLQWHVHLPVDFDWSPRQKGGIGAANMALKLWEKVAFLRPRYAVLHPPTFVQDATALHVLLQDFLHTWHKHCSAPLLLENIEHGDVQQLSAELFGLPVQNNETRGGKNASHNVSRNAPHNISRAYGICLDVGHMLAFGQEGILQRPDLLRKVQLVHWSAPGKRDEHLPLPHFTTEQKALVKLLAQRLPAKAQHMIEVFSWQGICESVDFLQQTLESAHGEKS